MIKGYAGIELNGLGNQSSRPFPLPFGVGHRPQQMESVGLIWKLHQNF